MYTAEIKQKLDEMAAFFSDNINGNEIMELLWSNKLGYVFIYLERFGDDETALNANQIETPEELIWHIYLVNALDIMTELYGVEVELEEATEEQKETVCQRMSDFTTRFPEYTYLLEQLFEPD